MKETHLYKEIFRLAVRLTGLFFLCIGLKDLVVQTFLALAQTRGTPGFNIATNILPVVFTLTVALWLLRGNGLIRLAYPEPGKTSPPATPAPHAGGAEPAPAPNLSEMQSADQKLAALVARKQGWPA